MSFSKSGGDAHDPHGHQPILCVGTALHSARAAILLAHGRGASASDILSLADDLDLTDTAYLAPEAAGNTWYPYSFLAPLADNQPWLDSALRLIERTVEGIVEAGIPRERIGLVGFSQGACLVTEFAARNARRYGALAAFTGGLIGPAGTKFEYAGSLEGTACFLGAGDPDTHVPWARVQESASILSGMGADVVLRRYPGMPHTINADEIAHAQKILRAIRENSLR